MIQRKTTDTMQAPSLSGAMETPDVPEYGWVLFDISCGFCSHWVPFWRTTLRKRGFAIAPLQSPWVRAKLGLSELDILLNLRLLLHSGQHISGADAYRYLLARIWWAWPIYLFSIAPLSSRLFDWGYHTFAKNRFAFSGACGIPNQERRSA